MTPEEILDNVLEASKTHYKVDKDGNCYFDGMPDYYEGYADAVNQRKRIKVHAEIDVFPYKLFKHRAPNQNEEEDEFLRKNYKNTTHPVFVDYMSVVTTGLNDYNWSIEYPQNSESYVEYIHNGIKGFTSLDGYVKQIIPTTKAKDPNGVVTFTVAPNLVEIDGELRVDDTENLKPQPIYYKCDNVVAWSDNYAMLESHEKSVVEYYGKMQRVGRVFYYYDTEYIYKIIQKGKLIDNVFDIIPIFKHDLGYLPCEKLKGVPTILEDGSIYYTSPFYYAVDLLDWSLTYSNYLNVSVANSAFPFRIMVGDACDFQNEAGKCFNGKWISNDGSGGGHCPDCHGSGMKVRVSPMGTYLLRPKQGQDDGDTSFKNPVEYVSPDREILDFVKELAKQYFNDARSILHIHSSNSEVKGSEEMTATGMAIDQKAKFAFVQPISDQDFDIYQFYLDLFADLRGEEAAKLTYPKTFDFLTEADILNDIAVARASGAPAVIIHALIYQFIDRRFHSEGEKAKAIEVLIAADRLLTLSNDDIIKRKAQGAVDNWEIVLHDSGLKFINELILADPNFLELELEDQVSKLEELAKTSTPNQSANRAQELADRLIGG
jgi:hypothetical protein